MKYKANFTVNGSSLKEALTGNNKKELLKDIKEIAQGYITPGCTGKIYFLSDGRQEEEIYIFSNGKWRKKL